MQCCPPSKHFLLALRCKLREKECGFCLSLCMHAPVVFVCVHAYYFERMCVCVGVNMKYGASDV